jgi:hypothetical protein
MNSGRGLRGVDLAFPCHGVILNAILDVILDVTLAVIPVVDLR